MTAQSLRLRTYEPATSMAAHAHDEPSMSIVVHGDFVERIGRGERAYARSYVAFVPAGVTHAQTFGAQGARQITFRPQSEWIDYLADCGLAVNDAPHARAAVFSALGDQLLRESRTKDPFSALASEGAILEVVAAFGRACVAPPPTPGRPPAWLCAARDFIHANALMPLDTAQIARAAGRHEIHLAREFRRHFGAPIGAYVRRLKTEHAARLLRDGRGSVSEIALDCGFSSHAHLCREFKAHFGVTPSGWRAETERA
jgi:AraC family transcriptional regulator